MFIVSIEASTLGELLSSLENHADALRAPVAVSQETKSVTGLAKVEPIATDPDDTPPPEKKTRKTPAKAAKAKRPPKAKSNGNGEAKDEPAPTPEALNEMARQYAIEHGADTVHELLEKAGATRLTLLTESGRIKMHALLTETK